MDNSPYLWVKYNQYLEGFSALYVRPQSRYRKEEEGYEWREATDKARRMTDK